jgi:hypothetical protein
MRPAGSSAGSSTISGSRPGPGDHLGVQLRVPARHPVKLAIDGTVITPLTADDHGVVSYPLNLAALGLRPGHHVLTLQGMLITTTASFRS